MNALPCWASVADRSRQASEDAAAKREAWVEQRAADLKAEYLADLEIVSECTADVIDYSTKRRCNPVALPILRLIRDGSDDAELGRAFRLATLAVIEQKANDDAEDQADEVDA